MQVPVRALGVLAVLLAFAGILSATWSGSAAAQETIAAGDIWFCDGSFQGGVCSTTITAGETVVWDFSGAILPHTTTECGVDCDSPTDSPAWDSGIIDDGGGFQFTFSGPGTYLYRCNVHPDQMRGRIIVQAPAQEPTAPAEEPTVRPDGDDSAAPTVTPGGAPVSGAPATGQGPGEASSGSWWTLAALAMAGAALVGLGAGTYRKARQRR